MKFHIRLQKFLPFRLFCLCLRLILCTLLIINPHSPYARIPQKGFLCASGLVIEHDCQSNRDRKVGAKGPADFSVEKSSHIPHGRTEVQRLLPPYWPKTSRQTTPVGRFGSGRKCNSLKFQETGFLVVRQYETAKTVPRPRLTAACIVCTFNDVSVVEETSCTLGRRSWSRVGVSLNLI